MQSSSALLWISVPVVCLNWTACTGYCGYVALRLGRRLTGCPALTLVRYVREAYGQCAISENQQKAYACREPAGFG